MRPILILSSTILLAGCQPPSRTPETAEPPSEKPPVAAPSPIEAPPLAPAAPKSPQSSVTASKQASSEALLLVDKGQALAAIIPPAQGMPEIDQAIARFVERVHRSTGVKIPIASSAEGTDRLRIEIFVQGVNDNEVTRALEPESYRIEASPAGLRIYAAAQGEPLKSNPSLRSEPLIWALNALLEEHLGARWLWPGELGTYLPQKERFEVPYSIKTHQPKLEYRSLRLLAGRKLPLASTDGEINARIESEAIQWSHDHRLGSRSAFVFGHSFSHWWARYSADHPDYFAELPPPHKQPFPNPGYIKLRLSNPAVIEQIAKEYEEAGAPKYWNVCPNDGSGFDISKETLAWDYPKGQTPHDIFSAKANLTARYVRFWNLLYDRLKQINPEVALVTYAYSSYREAPHASRPFTANAIIQIVDSAEAYDNWKGWARGGQKLLLRPNWWHQGAEAPYLNYEMNNRFVRFAWDNGMLGIDMDSLLGYWATQGFNYYSMARLCNDPSISDATMIEEYVEAFGPAAGKIREYLLYWAELAKKYNYPMNATGTTLPRGKYADLVRQEKVPHSILNGSKYALPFLYTDRVLAPALAMLDEAEALIDNPTSEEARRVQFLRAGLDSLKATREQIELGQKLKKSPTSKLANTFVENRKELEAQREIWSKDHVIWGVSTKTYEERYKILLRESALEHNEINLDGY